MGRVVFGQGGLWAGWSMGRVVYGHGGLASEVPLHWVVDYGPGGLWTRWSFGKGGLASEVPLQWIVRVWMLLQRRMCSWGVPKEDANASQVILSLSREQFVSHKISTALRHREGQQPTYPLLLLRWGRSVHTTGSICRPAFCSCWCPMRCSWHTSFPCLRIYSLYIHRDRYRQTDRQTDRHIHSLYIHRDRYRQTDRQTYTNTRTHTHSHTRTHARTHARILQCFLSLLAFIDAAVFWQ